MGGRSEALRAEGRGPKDRGAERASGASEMGLGKLIMMGGTWGKRSIGRLRGPYLLINFSVFGQTSVQMSTFCDGCATLVTANRS